MCSGQLINALEAGGFRVVVTQYFNEALSLAKGSGNETPCLVNTSVNLSKCREQHRTITDKTGGFALYEAIRAINSVLPVLLYTDAESAISRAQRYNDPNFIGVNDNPSDEREIVDMIKGMLLQH